MNNKVKCWLLVVVAFASFCGTTNAASQSDTLILVNARQSDSLDPVRGESIVKLYLTLVYDNLVGITPEGQISKERGIAHDWQMSRDGKVWTFHLRQGVKFHDGEELTADDVKFSLERVLSPYSVSTFASSFRETIEKIEILDRYTIKIYCKVPAPLFLYDLSPGTGSEGFIVPKKYIEKHGNEHFAQHPIGTGPYKAVEVVGGYHIKLTAAFQRHWLLGELKFKNVILRHVPEELARIGMVEIGEADIVPISGDQALRLKEKGFTIIEDPGAAVGFIAPVEQWKKEHPVHKKKVRQALALAIDGKEVFEHLYYGIGRLSADVNAIKGSLGYTHHPPYPYDPEKSKVLLKEAGYPNGFDLTIHSFPISARFPHTQKLLEVLASYFENIGVRVKIIPYADWGSVRPKFLANELGNSMFAMTSGGRPIPLKTISLWWHKDSKFRFAESAELTSMIERANKTLDENERIRLIKKISKYIYDNYHFLWAMESSEPFAISKKLKPWSMGPMPFDINLRHVVKK